MSTLRIPPLGTRPLARPLSLTQGGRGGLEELFDPTRQTWRVAGTLTALVVGWLSVWLAPGADAKPEYARKEGVPCLHCHMNGSPGSLDQLTGRRQTTDRNPRGIYYGTHNHSLIGYVEGPATRGAAVPIFRFAWKEEFKTLPRRIAVADVTGDGKPRLISLSEKPENKNESTLEVKRWDGKAFVTEFTGDAHAAADRLAVGKVGGSDRPAVILTSDALWVWDGSTFSRRPAPSPLPIVGVTRLRDGTERVLLAPTSTSLLAYRVNLTAVKKNDWLIDPIKAPSPPQNLWGDMHTSPEFLAAMGIPDAIGAGGMFGVWYVNKFNAYFIYYIKLDRDFDVKPDPQNPDKPKFVYKNPRYFASLWDTHSSAEIWTSPRLPGEGLDLVLDDPKGSGKPGFLILFDGTLGAGTTPAKGRTLAFFPMD